MFLPRPASKASVACTEISPVVNERAVNDNTIAATAFARRCRFFTL